MNIIVEPFNIIVEVVNINDERLNNIVECLNNMYEIVNTIVGSRKMRVGLLVQDEKRRDEERMDEGLRTAVRNAQGTELEKYNRARIRNKNRGDLALALIDSD